MSPYTSIDHETWRSYFSAAENTWRIYSDSLHPFYLDNVDVLSRFKDRIPTLQEINDLLSTIGWAAAYVDGYCPPWELASLLARRIMPISQKIRTSEEIFFGSEPDLIHDIFGHLPSLFNINYRALLARWANAAAQQEITALDQVHYHLNKLIATTQGSLDKGPRAHLVSASHEIQNFVFSKPSKALLLDKAYFWIFEFGMIESFGHKKIIGAGILSSLTEVEKLATRDNITTPLTLSSMTAGYNISSMQVHYFSVPKFEDFKQLIQSLEDVTTPSLQHRRAQDGR